MPKTGDVSRRVAVRTVGGAAIGAALCGVASRAMADDHEYHPQDQLKISQAAARYQDHPNGTELCGGCPYFIQSGGCVMVEGKISPNGWCPLFTTFSPLDRGAHA